MLFVLYYYENTEKIRAQRGENFLRFYLQNHKKNIAKNVQGWGVKHDCIPPLLLPIIIASRGGWGVQQDVRPPPQLNYRL